MAIRIGSNINSLQGQRQLDRAGRELSSTFERLSSGLRINRAGDDPAGLSLGATIARQRNSAQQGIRNVNDAISFLSVAESAIASLKTIVTRQQELATQAANSVYSVAQRTALRAEADALTAEYNRIIQTTSFNGTTLLDGTTKSISVQAGNSSYSIQGVDLSSTITVAIGNGTFAAATTLATGSTPYSGTAGDFNGDGKIDLVSADFGANSLSVFFGNGNGTFQSAQTISLGSSSRSVVTFDANGDGKLDLVSADIGASRMSVLLGNGNGTFQSAITASLTGGAFALTYGDINGDGKIDVAAALNSSGQAYVMLGNGNGTFQSAITLTAGSGTQSISLGDLNGDGKLDIVTGDVTANRLSVFLGNGNGTFEVARSIATAGGAQGVTQVDLNGDGKVDIISTDSSTNTLDIFFGNGNGTFQAVYTLATGTNPVKVIASDINGDGIVDLVSSDFSSGRLSVFLGNGNGTFAAVRSLTTGAQPFGIAAADVNGDGVNDLISTDRGAAQLSVFVQNSSTTTTVSSGLQSALDLSSTSGAGAAATYLAQISANLDRVGATVGAGLTRLEVSMSNLASTADTMAQAYSRVMDVDVAEEAAKLIRLQIRQQAITSVLAQANLEPQRAIQLLAL